MSTPQPQTTYSPDQIVSNELNRITKKKHDIDDEYNTQKRLLGFNNSFNDRYSYYISMLYVTIGALVIFIILTVIGNIFPIPSIIIDILAIILICGTAAILLSYYITISNRSQMNFSELELPSPYNDKMSFNNDNNLAILNNNNKNATQLSLFGNVSLGCTGPDCCETADTSTTNNKNTVWDPLLRKCIRQGFTNMEITDTVSVMPNSAYEFSNYSNY